MKVYTVASVTLTEVLQNALTDNSRTALTEMLEVLSSHTYLMKLQLTDVQKADIMKIAKEVQGESK